MKTLFNFFFVLFLTAGVFSSCAVVHNKHRAPRAHKAPPGQVKKITGSKSAKPYAPGQNKKKRKHKNLP